MKRILLAILCGVNLFACQQKHDGYVIHGYINGNTEGMNVELVNSTVYPPVTLDSTVIRNNRFEFKGKLELPGLYQITIDKAGKKDFQDMLASQFYLENSDITYTGHVDSLETYYWNDEAFRKGPVIRGSANQELYQQYQQITRSISERAKEVDEKYLEIYHCPAIKGIFNTEEGIQLAKESEKIQKEKEVARWNFIEQHPATIVGYDLASQFLESMYVDLTVPQINQLTTIITNAWTNYPQKITEFKEKAEKAEKIALGVKYQDVELMNQKGETIKLSEYIPEGKYVLLEFWASWCGPCRAEIPHLRHVYQNYKDKGFEIISISIDENKADWEKAMKEESMVWKQLCAHQGFNGSVAKKYNLTGVPTSFLLDKEGRIFKIEMRGAALDAVLQELCNAKQ